MTAPAKAKVVRVDVDEIEHLLERVEPTLSAGDFAHVAALAKTLVEVNRLLQTPGTTVAQLRRLLGLSRRTKRTRGTERDTGNDGEQSTPPAPDTPPLEPLGDASNSPEPPADRPRPRGHGRLPTSAYEAAEPMPIAHPTLHRGDECPACASGRIHGLEQPARLARVFGQAPLVTLVWHCERLRCGGCGQVFTAPAPEQARGPKYSDSAVSMMALLRYGTGLPLHRLAHLQSLLKLPLPSSTQWQVVLEKMPVFLPVYEALVGAAADADLFHNDDTHMPILELTGKRRAKLLADGNLPDAGRTGLFTTGVVAQTKAGPIALFLTGRKHAGENLADVLDERDGRLGAPVLMSDALDRNVPKGHAVIEANCLQHARRHVVEQQENFPQVCGHVLAQLGKVFKNEKHCKKEGLGGEARLRYHQEKSAPVMAALHAWMSTQLDQKYVEPNSGLGQALRYMLTRWDKLTAFLRVRDAPLENNICERALKKAIIHRNNSRAYRSRRGAHVGDVYMALIYTAELHGVNPFEYLTDLQRHEKEVAEAPELWLPWTYAETLAKLQAKQRAA